MNTELYHWKYVKREKKNGKWVYTYDNDKLGVKNFIDTKVTGKAYKQHAQEALKNNINTNNQLASTAQRRIHAEQTAKGYSQTDPKVIKLKQQESALSRKSAASEKEYRDAMNNYKNNSVVGRTASNINNIKSNVKSGVSIVKDKLGYDERDALDKAQKEVNETSYKKANALTNAKDAYDYAERYGDDSFYETRADEYRNAKESHDKAVSKRDKAKAVYYDTPIGKLAEAGEKIEAATDYVEDLFKRKRTVSFKSTTDELKELEDFERMLNQRKKK